MKKKQEIEKKFTLKQKHFDIFAEEFSYWIQTFSLNNWEYHFTFGADGPDDTSRAHLYRDHVSRICLVFLNDSWDGTEPNEVNIRLVAFHEATEMLLSKMNDLANAREFSKDEMEEAVHTVIRTLENTYFKADLETRLE